jgi:hypothetical protein
LTILINYLQNTKKVREALNLWDYLVRCI